MATPYATVGPVWASQWKPRKGLAIPYREASGRRSTPAVAASPAPGPHHHRPSAYAARPIKTIPSGTMKPA